ncbi:MAG: 4'-phosphopantetheinyl transferase superfamily protein [Acidobacteria bacterium]|nr:4'-phosphopantetheinyl transferase superfamily protein [Acidobacteriota bacterium]
MDEQVHIWWANLRDFDPHVPELQSVLSVLEHARAGRFQFLRDRNNYIICHGLLRMLLGSYAGKSPFSLCFRAGTYGKPELQDVIEERRIHFNLSHSEDVALYGITRGCPIGVDVEYVRTFPDYERLAQEFFSRAECKSLKATREEVRAKRFFELWTRKEALLKGTGQGLGDGLAGRVDSLLEPDVSGCTDLPQTFGMPGDWQIRSFSPVEGYIAAVASAKANVNFICRGVPVFFSEGMCRSGCYVPQSQDGI